MVAEGRNTRKLRVLNSHSPQALAWGPRAALNDNRFNGFPLCGIDFETVKTVEAVLTEPR